LGDFGVMPCLVAADAAAGTAPAESAASATTAVTARERRRIVMMRGSLPMARVLVTRQLVGPALDRLRAAHEVDVWPGTLPPSPAVLRGQVTAVDGLLCLLTERVDEELLDAAPRLKVIANYAVGTDNIDLEACRARGIAVGRTPDVLTDATADLTWALILAAARRLEEAAAAVRAGEWHTFEPARWLGVELAGKTLGVIGFGRIGQAVARRAGGFGMDVLPARRDDDPLEVIARSDVITLHAPLTDATRGLIGPQALARAKPGAILVNTARGGLVDPEALAVALRDGRLAAAALDVTDPEPLPADHPLLDVPNLLVVPHIGSATVEARSAMTARAVANLEAGLAGEPLPFSA
jgi:glyoxylate reductase